VDVFRARIIDVANDSLMIEITGNEDKIEGFVEMLRPFGILEMVRAGVVAMGRGPNALGAAFINGNGNGNRKNAGKVGS
jgi:acetolactate synthase-1/3 small subunit